MISMHPSPDLLPFPTHPFLQLKAVPPVFDVSLIIVLIQNDLPVRLHLYLPIVTHPSRLSSRIANISNNFGVLATYQTLMSCFIYINSLNYPIISKMKAIIIPLLQMRQHRSREGSGLAPYQEANMRGSWDLNPRIRPQSITPLTSIPCAFFTVVWNVLLFWKLP